jgi:aspartate 1-decarboxylase
MLRELLYAKIHKAVVTDCNPDYMGSITIDPVLLEATGMVVNEKVLVADCNNGNRFETYIFLGERGSGQIRVNGAAADLTGIGHRVLIMSFCQMTEAEMERHRPRVVICDERNRIAELIEYPPSTSAAAVEV